MSRRLPLIVLAALIAAAIGYAIATHRGLSESPGSYKGDGRVQIPRPAVNGNEVGLESHSVQIPPESDPVKGALDALLAAPSDETHPRAIPAGTKLLSVRLEKGVAIVDLSGDFSKLNQSGDTAESLAQNALRKTLAQFPDVKSMLVKVNGRPFESEHTDWTEPIAVRNEDATAPSP